MFFATIKEARTKAIHDACFSDDGVGEATANLRNGNHATVIARLTSGGNVRCKIERGIGHLTTEPPTGGLADMIREHRYDLSLRRVDY